MPTLLVRERPDVDIRLGVHERFEDRSSSIEGLVYLEVPEEERKSDGGGCSDWSHSKRLDGGFRSFGKLASWEEPVDGV